MATCWLDNLVEPAPSRLGRTGAPGFAGAGPVSGERLPVAYLEFDSMNDETDADAGDAA